MPSKADPVRQTAFLADVLKPAMKRAKEGLLELFFVDASHFVMGGTPGRLWSKVRRWVRTGSGRKRFNVLGAINFASRKMETVTNDTYITATQVVQLLKEVADLYVGRPIAMVMDNATYQKCRLVKETAEQLKIDLIFLPTYSPNLNLIERVWKFVKARVLSARYIGTFEEYCRKIRDFVEEIDVDYAADMKTLLSEKFQSFEKCRIL